MRHFSRDLMELGGGLHESQLTRQLWRNMQMRKVRRGSFWHHWESWIRMLCKEIDGSLIQMRLVQVRFLNNIWDRRRLLSNLVGTNEYYELELPRAWEPLVSLGPERGDSERRSQFGFSHGNQIRKGGNVESTRGN